MTIQRKINVENFVANQRQTHNREIKMNNLVIYFINIMLFLYYFIPVSQSILSPSQIPKWFFFCLILVRLFHFTSLLFGTYKQFTGGARNDVERFSVSKQSNPFENVIYIFLLGVCRSPWSTVSLHRYRNELRQNQLAMRTDVRNFVAPVHWLLVIFHESTLKSFFSQSATKRYGTQQSC